MFQGIDISFSEVRAVHQRKREFDATSLIPSHVQSCTIGCDQDFLPSFQREKYLPWAKAECALWGQHGPVIPSLRPSAVSKRQVAAMAAGRLSAPACPSCCGGTLASQGTEL